MDQSELIFTLFYILICASIIYPPTEFVSCGLTIESIFAKLLGSEEINFVLYHQKRCSLTLCIHILMPSIYMLIYHLQFRTNMPDGDEFISASWSAATRLQILGIIAIPVFVIHWFQNNWENHPISQRLQKFSNARSRYTSVADAINTEFRRQDVLVMKINAISKVIATENWIIKTGPYNVYFSHQSDTSLNVIKSETFTISENSSDTLQMINISVKSARAGVDEFSIRINALDFRNLQDRISRPIFIPPNIHFHRSIIERFIEVFKEQVALNPIVPTMQITDSCFACMLAVPNIKIQKQCLDTIDPTDQPCKNCYCRPMWCVECLAKWFASRQKEFEKEVWLEKKCTCPLCRAQFCIRDVCYIEPAEN